MPNNSRGGKPHLGRLLIDKVLPSERRFKNQTNRIAIDITGSRSVMAVDITGSGSVMAVAITGSRSV